MRAGLVSCVAGLAGCRSEDRTAQSTSGTDAAFGDITVDGTDLVVELDDDSVEKITVVQPDGSLYATRTVETGVSTVRFQLLELKLGQADHYPPGEYEIVAVIDDQTISQTVDLQPELVIRDIGQYRAENKPEDYGHIAVTIENRGTAPTWIYDLAYENPPRHGAKDELGSRPGIPHLKHPEEVKDLILFPGTQKQYVESVPLLRFNERGEYSCGDKIETTLLIGIGTGDQIREQLRMDLDGESVSVSAIGDFVCDQVTIDRLDSDASLDDIDIGGHK